MAWFRHTVLHRGGSGVRLFFFSYTETTNFYTLSLHDALPILGDAGIKSAIQGSNVPNPDEAVPSFVSGAMDGLIRVRNIRRSEERFSRNAATDLVCRLLLEK